MKRFTTALLSIATVATGVSAEDDATEGIIVNQQPVEYQRQDPTLYDPKWKYEKAHEEQRKRQDCFCDENKGTAHFWKHMLGEIHHGVE